VDAPTPANLRLQFIYNFFEADERTVDGSAQESGAFARAFKLEWSPLGISVFQGNTSSTSETAAYSTIEERLLQDLISGLSNENSGLKVNEDKTATRNSFSAFIQDQNFDTKYAERLVESVSLRNLSTGSASDIGASVKTIIGRDFVQSDLDIREIVPALADPITRRTISTDYDSNDESFQFLLDDERARAAFQEFEGSPVVKASYEVFNDLRDYYVVTNDTPDESDVNPRFDGLPTSESTSGILPPPTLLGYMIEKFSDDPAESYPKRFIVPRGTRSYLDAAIKYGKTYSYRIRSIVAVYTVAEVVYESSVPRPCIIPFVSNPTKLLSLKASESVPPTSPADFNLHWNYQDSTLQIVWSFPNNPQRDIKYWQVFRRGSINEPFALIRMIDFDDSTVRSEFPETIDPSLISKFQSSVNYYVDPEFSKDSDHIYTMCSVDAHGQSSNYGMQFRVRFDRYKNKLIKELISPSGAMKQYPNTYLNAELTLDSVKSSGATKMRIYFDPEYLVVTGLGTTSLVTDRNFLRTSESAIYQLQLINIDRQKQSEVIISISDPDGYIATTSAIATGRASS
jgi:hypothetical protein